MPFACAVAQQRPRSPHRGAARGGLAWAAAGSARRYHCSHARQLRRLPGRQEARRHRAERDPRLSRQAGRFVWVALTRRLRRRAAGDAASSSTCTSSPSRTRTTATSGPRSRSTATSCSPCCTWSKSRARSCSIGEVASSSGPNYVLSVRNRSEQGFLGRARALRARARAAEARLRLRPLRADGRGRRPLLPGARRDRDRARGDRGAHLRQHLAARQHRGALLREAEADHAQARHRAAAWTRWASSTAGACRRSARAWANTSATSTTTWCASTSRSTPLRDTVTTAIQVNLAHDHHRRERGHQAPGGLRRPGRGADHDRRRLRHELRAHAGAEVGLGLPVRGRPDGGRSTSACSSRFRKARWL